MMALAGAAAAALEVVEIPRGEARASDWIHVPAGKQVRWDTVAGYGYVWGRAEVRDGGVLASNDGWIPDGCARWDRDFDFRLWWSNTLWEGNDQTFFDYSVEVENATQDCPTVPQAMAADRRNHDLFAATEFVGLPNLRDIGVAIAFGSVVTAVVVKWTERWQKRSASSHLKEAEATTPRRP